MLRSLTAEDDTDASSLCPNQKHDCLLLQIGSLLCALESLDLWPEKDPDDIHISPKQLQELLSNIRLSDCQRHNIGKSRKKGSRWGDYDLGSEDPIPSTYDSFAGVVRQVLDVAPQDGGVSEAQEKHMATQRRKFNCPCDNSARLECLSYAHGIQAHNNIERLPYIQHTALDCSRLSDISCRQHYIPSDYVRSRRPGNMVTEISRPTPALGRG